jgi:hypothetical protein
LAARICADRESRQDAAYRVAPLVRTSAGISLQPFRGAAALPIRAIGPYYVASARELERFGDGRRYVLWKEFYMSEPPPEESDEQRIKVNVYVGRFEREGTLSGLATLPIAVMSRVGFDYATILPDGTIALLASIVADGKPGPFKIYHLRLRSRRPIWRRCRRRWAVGAIGPIRRWPISFRSPCPSL